MSSGDGPPAGAILHRQVLVSKGVTGVGYRLSGDPVYASSAAGPSSDAECSVDVAQIAFGLDPAHSKVVSTPDATRVLYLAAANEDASAAAWRFLVDFWPQLVQTRGASV